MPWKQKERDWNLTLEHPLQKNKRKDISCIFISIMQKRNIIEEIKNLSKRPLEQGCPPKRERNDFPLN